MDDLRRWLSGHGAHIDPRLVLVSREGGNHVEALSPISAGETVARIAKTLVLSNRTSSLVVPPHLVDRLEHAPPPLQLAVHVLHEMLCGSTSEWAIYLATCPSPDMVSIAALWPEDGEARRWSRGTQLEQERKKLVIDEKTLARFFIDVAHAILSSGAPQSPSPTLASFRHAYILVSTRAFLVDAFHQLSLVPLADLFDHEQESAHNAHFASDQWVCSECGRLDACEHDVEDDVHRRAERALDERENTCDMVCNRPIAAADEIFNHYGPGLSNAKLALHYGFSLEANEHDEVDFDSLTVSSAFGLSSEELEELRARRELVLVDEKAVLLIEADHPLLLPPETPPAASDRLFIDADTRLSFALWSLLALIALPSDMDSTDILPGLLSLTRVARLWADAQDSEDDDLQLSEEEVVRLRRVGSLITRLVGTTLEKQTEPSLSAVDLLDLAEHTSDASTRLAIELLAGERLLLERLKQSWTLP
ncbi:hypothetical protein JCM8547_003481 [Rhodosporidiobolus lusitaniae]